MSGMMTLQNNLMAMDAYRHLGVTTNNKAKSTRKLSSGFKINSAADDAAGLSISEKMRNAIRGLKQGSDNISDGISMTQTAEGALSEVTDMLQRISELSIKAYNETNTESDQQDIQAEISQLTEEIKRTADTTTFNEIPLLKGNPWATEKVMVKAPWTEELTRTYQTNVTAPEWLKYDEKLEKGHNYSEIPGNSDGKMPYLLWDSTGTNITTYKYWGKQDSDYEASHKIGNTEIQYAGDWDTDPLNNASSKISLAELASDKDINQLYIHMTDLLGVSIGAPCGGNHGILYGVTFNGKVDGIETVADSFNTPYGNFYLPGASVNLPEVSVDGKGIFDAVKEMGIELKNADELSDADKENKVQELAGKIATAIRDAAVKAMSDNTVMNGEYRYDRVVPSGDYDMIIYDYRDVRPDVEGLHDYNVVDSTVYTDANAVIREGYTVDHAAEYEDQRLQRPVEIVCSGTSGDKVLVNLPDVRTLWEDSLTNYDVSRYTVSEVVTYEAQTETDEDYQKRLEEYEKELAEYKQKKQAYEDDLAQYNLDKADYDKAKLKWQKDMQDWETEAWKPENTETKTIHIKDTITRAVTEIINGVPVRSTKQIPREYDQTVKVSTYNVPKPVLTATPPQMHTTDPGKPPQKPVKGDIPPKKIVTQVRKYDPSDVSEIDDALKKVLRWRSELGAEQNRLEHTLRNNANKEENTTASESVIRDTDVAKEMVQFSMQNILEQAGTSMLSQANQNRQNILSLLG